MARVIPITLLVGVLITSYFSMFKLAEDNGSFSLPSVFEFTSRKLADSDIPIHLPQTGIVLLDNYNAFMASVFWVALNPANVRAHLQATHFIGTISSQWLLMLLEAHRGTTSTPLLAATYLLEFGGELLGLGFFTPLWCIAHLLTRAPLTASANNGEAAAKALGLPQGKLAALGYAIILGHLVPTIALMVGKIDSQNLWASQQVWSILRLLHPLLVLVFWRLFSLVSVKTTSVKPTASALYLSSARKLYQYSIVASTIPHILSFSILLGEHWAPGYVSTPVVNLLSDYKAAILPFSFWTTLTGPVQKVTFTEGVRFFLQWDEILTASSSLIWAGALYVEALRSSKTKSLTRNINLVLECLFVAVFCGPVAASATMLMARDDLVLEAAELENVKSSKEQ